MERKHFLQIDMLKGFAAIMVAVGHLAFMGDGHRLFYRWIFQCHMPVFFWTAGFCFSKRTIRGSFAGFVWKKVRTLVVPDLLFRFVWVWLCAAKAGNIEGYWESLPEYMYHYSTEWLVPSLLISYVLLFLFSRLHRRVGISAIALGGLLIVFTPFLCREYGLIIGHDGLYLPFLPDSTLLGFSFMLIGYLCRRIPSSAFMAVKNGICRQAGARACAWLSLVLCLMGWYTYTQREDYGVVNIAMGTVGDSELLYFFFALFWIGALFVAFTLLLRTSKLLRMQELLKYAGRGRHSLAIYLLHILLNGVWEILFWQMTGREWLYWEYPVSVRLVYAVGVITLSLGAIFLYERLKSRRKETDLAENIEG